MKKAFIAALLLAAVSLAAQCPPDRTKEVRFTLNDSIIRHDMALLSEQQTIPLCYNSLVKRFIDLFANQINSITNRMLYRSYTYCFVIEKTLQSHGLPIELKYFAMVVSAMNPTAQARNGRNGLWQLSSSQATQYGLTINDFVNECFDPVLATEAACMQIVDLYAYYDDWLLAMTASQTGCSVVDKAITASDGNRDYWAIQRHLPIEVQGYIPVYMALVYLANRPEAYGLCPVCPIDIWRNTVTLTITESLSFEQIKNVSGISVEVLTLFNPKYVKKEIPASPEHPQTIRLHQDHVDKFKQSFKTI